MKEYLKENQDSHNYYKKYVDETIIKIMNSSNQFSEKFNLIVKEYHKLAFKVIDLCDKNSYLKW